MPEFILADSKGIKMAYLYGQLVTATEKEFLTDFLQQNKTKIEQVKQLKMIKRYAGKNNTSIIDSAYAVENNKKSIDGLNKKFAGVREYGIDKEGEICIIKYDEHGNSFKRKLTKDEKDELDGKKISKKKNRFPLLKKLKDKVKYCIMYVSEMFTVY